MQRTITEVIDGVEALLPDITLPQSVVGVIDPTIADNLVTLRAELAILRRQADYTATEAEGDLWARLSTACYRYLPPVKHAAWTRAIADLLHSS